MWIFPQSVYTIHVYFVILFSPLLCSALLYYIPLQSTALLCSILLSNLLCSTLLCSAPLYFPIYSTRLCSTPQSTLLNLTMLCSSLLYSPQVESTSIGWSLGYMLAMSNMIPSEVKKIPPMTDPLFAGLIFLFSALTIVTVVFIFIILIRTCYWGRTLWQQYDLPLWGCCNPARSRPVTWTRQLFDFG